MKYYTFETMHIASGHIVELTILADSIEHGLKGVYEEYPMEEYSVIGHDWDDDRGHDSQTSHIV